MTRYRSLLAGLLGLALAASPAAAQPDLAALRQTLNESRSVAGTDASKSYATIFDAYLDLSPPPAEVGRDFNHLLIHPGMKNWAAVRDWAESNPEMAEAIRTAAEKTLFGLPYGADAVASHYREADLTAEFAANDDLRESRYPWLRAIDTVAAFSCAESYRLLEAGQAEEGVGLAVANIFLLRQCCDREFLSEQLYAITLLSEALSNLRDQFYLYLDVIPSDLFAEIAMRRIPFIRPDRSRLFMPEGDKLVAAALLASVFDESGQPNVERMTRTFAAIQSQDEPLTRFGAAKRWSMIGEIHDSKDSSIERLDLVYDDWWRRWRVQEYDPILAVPTQFSRTNPIRFAAVIYSLQDIEQLFQARDMLIAQTWGTATAAGICGYHRSLGTWPREVISTYAVSLRKSMNRDPFDLEFGLFKYEIVSGEKAIDTDWGRLVLESGEAVLWSKGTDRTDDRGTRHSFDGSQGDLVLWPPIKASLRSRGMME